MFYILQRSFCGNYSDTGYYKYERSNTEMSVLQDNAERVITIHSKGTFRSIM